MTSVLRHCECLHSSLFLSLLSQGTTAKQLVLNKCLVMRFLDSPTGPGHAFEGQSGRSTLSFGLCWNLGKGWRLRGCWCWLSPGSKDMIRRAQTACRGVPGHTGNGQGRVHDSVPSPPCCREDMETELVKKYFSWEATGWSAAYRCLLCVSGLVLSSLWRKMLASSPSKGKSGIKGWWM